MIYRTLQDVRKQLNDEHDLTEETFVTPDELRSYIWEGINHAENEIITQYEDYLLTRTEWLSIPDSNQITMPTDMYAFKIRKLEVRSTADNRLQLHKNRHLEDTDDFYNPFYQIVNKSGETPVLEFQGLDNNFQEYRIHYTRNYVRPVNETDSIDLPEFAVEYMMAFVKYRLFQKEKEISMLNEAKLELRDKRNQLREVLTNIVEDGTEIIKPDFELFGFDDTAY